LIVGNEDDCLRYALGGIQLYDKMIDINPFNRGYYYLKELFGNSEKLHYFHSQVKYFDDISKIELIKYDSNINTIVDILSYIHEEHPKKIMQHKTHRDLIEYSIKEDVGRLYAEVINFDQFIADNIPFVKTIMWNTFRNSVGSSIDNQVVCISISPVSGECIAISNNKFGSGGFCVLEESNADVYELPLFKFRGTYDSFYLKFTNPPGTKLLNRGIDVLDNNGTKSFKVFVFTSAPLTTGFNMYDISDL
jgi:hypothetical protein